MSIKNIESQNIVIIGAGSAGLSTSFFLTKQGIEHVVLERGNIANTWKKERWDGFYLVNPNWAIRLPGFHYVGTDPDGYLSKNETIHYLQDYAAHFGAPVRTNTNVNSLEKTDNGYQLLLDDGNAINANGVIVATGAFGIPRIPSFSTNISKKIHQIHSATYVNPQSLPDGAVLVVGSGQSGAQIAEELHQAERRVFLAVSSAGRRPRRYRGRDSSWWNYAMGSFDKTVDDVESIVKFRFGPSAHTSGAQGGHDIYLRQLANEGVVLLGPVTDAHHNVITPATNLEEILKEVEAHTKRWKANVDRYIEKNGIQSHLDTSEVDDETTNWPEYDPPNEIDLSDAGIRTIIWATGFEYNYEWIKLPVTDDRNYPIQRRGVTKYMGLYFMGLQWMHGSKSAQFIGVGEDAEYVANHVASNFG